ncbi:MAG: hypothetical protein QM718_03420 [Steroidobacteraceae bacterium]
MLSDYAHDTNAHVPPGGAPLWQEPNVVARVEAGVLLDDAHSL